LPICIMGTPIRTAGMGITTDIAGTEVTTIIGIIDTGAITTRNSYRFDDPATCPRQHVLMSGSTLYACHARCPLWVKSGHLQCNSPCLLCANNGHCIADSAMPPLDEFGAKTPELVVCYRARFL
jgi:hypothetical protein